MAKYHDFEISLRKRISVFRKYVFIRCPETNVILAIAEVVDGVPKIIA